MRCVRVIFYTPQERPVKFFAHEVLSVEAHNFIRSCAIDYKFAGFWTGTNNAG